jgi:hypothetical protein
MLIPLIFHHFSEIEEKPPVTPPEAPRVRIGQAVYAGVIIALRNEKTLVESLGWTIVETKRDARGFHYFGYGPLRVVTYFQDYHNNQCIFHTYFYRMTQGMLLTPDSIRNNWPRGFTPGAYA